MPPELLGEQWEGGASRALGVYLGLTAMFSLLRSNVEAIGRCSFPA